MKGKDKPSIRRRGAFYATETTEELVLPTGVCLDGEHPEHVWSPWEWGDPVVCVHPGCRIPYYTWSVHALADAKTPATLQRGLILRLRAKIEALETAAALQVVETLSALAAPKPEPDTGECPLGRCTCDPWTPGRIVDSCRCRCHKVH